MKIENKDITVSNITLQDTSVWMGSDDYKVRFIAEYYQNKIRHDKLEAMVKNWDDGKLPFIPTCPRELYDRQLASMKSYIDILKERAVIENVELE